MSDLDDQGISAEPLTAAQPWVWVADVLSVTRLSLLCWMWDGVSIRLQRHFAGVWSPVMMPEGLPSGKDGPVLAWQRICMPHPPIEGQR